MKYLFPPFFLLVLLILGPGRVFELWAQGTTTINQTLRIASATPYTITLPDDDGDNGEVLTSDGSGVLSWAAAAEGADVVPSNVIAFSSAGACPSGWTEYTAARGRYIVGLPSGGTNEGTAGTALTNLENRAVGQHTHVQDSHNHTQDAHTHTQNSHNHTQNAHNHTVSNAANTISTDGDGAGDGVDNTGTKSTSSVTATNNAATATNNATTATNQSATATNQNAGSVAGTNAPYIQLVVCERD